MDQLITLIVFAVCKCKICSISLICVIFIYLKYLYTSLCTELDVTTTNCAKYIRCLRAWN